MTTRRSSALLSLLLGLIALGGVLASLEVMNGGLDIVRARSVARPSPHAIAATAGITRYVSSVSGGDTGDCADEIAPCRTIQYAVDQAGDGETILIARRDNAAPASYTGTGDSVITLGKSLILRGGYLYVHAGPVNTWTPGPRPSPVDGEGQRRALTVGGGVSPTLRMLSFVNGYAERGGNVYAENADPRFIATPIVSGTATYGGGLYLKNCRASFDADALSLDVLGEGWLDLLGVSGLVWIQNNAAEYGGGLYVEGGAPILAGLAVLSNTATADGGGVYLEGGWPVFAGGLILENRAGGRGGGFFLERSTSVIAGTAVYSNAAGEGAGLYLGPFSLSEPSIPIIANNYVRYNHAAGGLGGGLCFSETVAGLVNNVIADNRATAGAAMYLYASSPQFFHNTLAQNVGESGVHVTHRPGQAWPPAAPIPSRPAFTNTIVVSHAVGIRLDTTGLPNPLENRATLQGTLWWGNDEDSAGSGEIVASDDVDGPPRFTCTGGLPDCVLPYHLEGDSAAVDAGVVPALSIPGTDLLVDIDGQLRPSNQAYDVGADELVTRTLDVWFMPPASALIAAPGETVTHTHHLMNTGLGADTYDLTLHSDRGWATLTSEPSVSLGAQTSATVQVRVTVPETATNGAWDTSAITATSRGNPDRKAHALDLTSVITAAQTDLAVGKWAAAERVAPGGAVRFSLVVTATGSLAEAVDVTLADVAGPASSIAEIAAPSEGCSAIIEQSVVTCTLTLQGAAPVTRALDVVITTAEDYEGLLINTAAIRSTAWDLNPANNVAEAVVSVSAGGRIYLPLVVRD